ncbi:hypothetical protein G195_000103 [Phytophthora kernoviae 00238/432]|uniref:ABC transporter domain-containing protein n=1 Tax=Phytophthora kernoviae 00238/432 TaxID=1284355 RepID=A0A8J4WKK4_9STRA|nr:hypothetical protein G195_000103 [Phytophthora kernoviae 00238/432]
MEEEGGIGMAQIVLKQIEKSFKQDKVIEGLNLTIEDGSFTVLVGPSGCGKSTTLRMIAGLDKESGGEIWIGDHCVNGVEPGKRNIAMVFQNYALYPMMTVKENIEFGLVNRKVPRTERERLVKEITEVVGLAEYLHKKPQALSGGQRQRVALARAMVKNPGVFLMDEPLSNLDAKLRHQMRTELIQLHKRLGATFVFVTHDQVEAMSMGDRIVIMNKGRIQQADSPMKIYDDPDNVFTAQFIGTPPMNVIDRERILPLLHGQLHDEIGQLGFRPEKATMTTENRPQPGQLQFPARILTRETLGAEIIYQLESALGLVSVKSFLKPLESASEVYISVSMQDLYYFDRGVGLPKQTWLSSPDSSLLSLVLVSVWKGVGYNALIFIAGLQSIPKDVYEASALDEANWWRKFYKITLPMLSPTLFFLIIINLISSFQVFETIAIMTNGGPINSTNTLVFYIYEYGFRYFKIGYASAAGAILLVVVGLLTLVYFKLLSRKVHYQ